MNVRALWIVAIVVLLAAAGIFVFRSLSGEEPQVTGARTSAPLTTPVPLTTSVPASSSGANFVDPQPRTPTTVVKVVAVTGSGDPAPGYTVTEVSDAIEISGCFASRASVSPGVIRCGSTAASADVCWTTVNSPTLLCGITPWEKSLRRLKTSDKVDTIAAEPEPLPWGLELANGARCQLRNGGSWPGRADDYVGYYDCGGDSLYVVGKQDDGPVQRSAPVWTALVGGLSADNAEFPPPTKVRVVTAYFAARA
ncbi:hypothetical protein [Amycolatopsis speibonae]|uniref:Serine/threonine protein kinase n=1 Tax=Amycolatopsis speibonae TaxID=1450224 RepID=A0ABV7PCI4_9PSEU